MIIFLLFFVRKRAVTTTALSVYITTPFGEAPRRKDTYSVSHNFSHVKSGLYSEIEELNNSLSALDTRVTNAITGGSLAPPVSYDVLLSPYTDSEEGTDVSANQFYHQYKRTSEYSRVWNNTYKVPQRAKLIANLSAAVVAYSGSIKSVGLDVLNTAGSVVLVASPNGTTDLSSLAGQTVKLRFTCTNSIHIGFRATFSSLTITNK